MPGVSRSNWVVGLFKCCNNSKGGIFLSAEVTEEMEKLSNLETGLCLIGLG